MKKFIFSKFLGLQAYGRQLYYQMNSITGNYQQNFYPPPMLPPCIDLSPPPSNFEEPPYVLNNCGKPSGHQAYKNGWWWNYIYSLTIWISEAHSSQYFETKLTAPSGAHDMKTLTVVYFRLQHMRHAITHACLKH